MSRILKNIWIFRGTQSGLITLFSVVSHYIINRNWFTTSEQTIDPWIYWGAGNNLSLSYQSDFSKTYYLQRYVITLPQILYQFIFGPYWSQLALVTTYIFLICLLIYSILNLLNLNKYAFPACLIFFSNNKFLGMLAMSYNQAVSFTLFCTFLFFLIKFLKTQDYKLALITGLFVGLIANAYASHTLVVYAVSYILICRHGNFKVFFQWLKYTLFGFFFSQILIQIINYVIARENSELVILKHFKYGLSLVSNKNPWGGNGPIWFWTNGFFEVISFYWAALILMAILLFLINKKLYNVSTYNLFTLNLSAIATFIGTAIYSFGNSNIIGYSWFSCVLYWILLPTIIFVFSSLPNYLVYTITCAHIIFHLNNSQLLENILISRLSIDSTRIYILVLLFLFLLAKYLLPLKTFKFLICLGLSFLIMLIQSNYYVSSEGGIDKHKNAEAIYMRLDAERQGLNKLHKNTDKRIWLTPLEQTPLLSSMLYLYSLVSSEPNSSNCSQVNWMLGTNSILVITHSTMSKEKLVEDRFLIPCKAEIGKWKHFKMNNIHFSYLDFVN